MYVYETTNLINGKKYIGVCITKNKRKSELYLGSGILLVKNYLIDKDNRIKKTDITYKFVDNKVLTT